MNYLKPLQATPRNPGRLFKLCTNIYRLLPYEFRTSAKVAHRVSIIVSKLMKDEQIFVETPGGRMCIVANHPGDLQRAWGVWEINLRRYLMNVLRFGHTFVDVGAHRGTYTIMASHLLGRSGKVIAIEPWSDHYECLKHTATQTPYGNIHLVNAALGAKSGTTFFSKSERHVADKGVEVPLLALDDLVQNVDCIKIDTDGRELDVLMGGRRIIERGTEVVMEFSNFPYQPIETLWFDVNNFMSDFGYRPYIIDKNGLPHRVLSVPEIEDSHVLFTRNKIPDV